ncbi:MAG: metal-dependent transcriptional regulator [Lachnospiraceae bacterium]|nr:metal-dependent transcriptional regulator [Lachnospiraceae bacterium]
MKIQESAQDYLEAILVLSNEQSSVRAIDISEYFGYARATVSIFLKQLRENGYVTVDEHNHISLTEAGNKIAEETYEKHQVLTEIFKSIGVSDEVALNDACRIEHYISGTTFRALANHFNIDIEGEHVDLPTEK